ncbi:hypothetical protein DFP85_10446 [Halomonas ventosae]|uniref:Uncharacterized protein n=1 Tax=Halomonas ventosae TaxID=229007 RepID=A0A4R6ZTM3_9GAMM|nr:hypothetical protein [Halomonas ventosae]TDR56131.1 hypothetical protein DFP85_10446 [Halomonas ventosae]
MKVAKGLCAAALISLASSAWAENLVISDIPSPDFTEAQKVSSDEWVLVTEISSLALPTAATFASGTQRELVFSAGGQEYRIARADVVLENETLVTSACDTLALSISSDTRSASVKGAGESCE